MHPSIAKARAMIDRLSDKEVEWETENAMRDPDQEYWQAPPKVKLVRERQVSAEEADQMIQDLRDELTGLIEDAIANLRDELSAFSVEAAATAAEEAGAAIGKIAKRMDKVETNLTERFGPKLVSKDAASS
jgi:hypothetical protein